MPTACLKAPGALLSTQIPFWRAGKVRFESAVLAFAATTRGALHIGGGERAIASKAVAWMLVR